MNIKHLDEVTDLADRLADLEERLFDKDYPLEPLLSPPARQLIASIIEEDIKRQIDEVSAKLQALGVTLNGAEDPADEGSTLWSSFTVIGLSNAA